jgi:predicted nucleotidyltransferase component of viral defense system
MTFHQASDFEDALQAAAGHFNLRPIFIEKDYWVTHVLKKLSRSKHKDEVIFKGGTSLSKAFNCIERFSEDIDLALLKDSGTSANQLTKKMKAVEEAVTNELKYFQHEKEVKKGRNRTTFYHYPKVLKETDFSQIKDHVQLEINAFTNPVPYEEMSISSYVSQFLKQGGFDDKIEQYQLEPFTVNVLTRERTFFEKLLSLIRLSYEGPEKLREKIRHFYDLNKLLAQKELELLNSNGFKLIDLVKTDDNSNDIFKGEWMNKPLASSPLFTDIEQSWKSVESTYKKDLSELVWHEADLPKPEEIVETLSVIKTYLVEYDRSE